MKTEVFKKGDTTGRAILDFAFLQHKIVNGDAKKIPVKEKDLLLERYNIAMRSLVRLPKKQYEVAHLYLHGYELIQELYILTRADLTAAGYYFSEALRELENHYNAEVAFYYMKEQGALFSKEGLKDFTADFYPLTEKKGKIKGVQHLISLACVHWAIYMNYQRFLAAFVEYIGYEGFYYLSLEEDFKEKVQPLIDLYSQAHTKYLDFIDKRIARDTTELLLEAKESGVFKLAESAIKNQVPKKYEAAIETLKEQYKPADLDTLEAENKDKIEKCVNKALDIIKEHGKTFNEKNKTETIAILRR